MVKVAKALGTCSSAVSRIDFSSLSEMVDSGESLYELRRWVIASCQALADMVVVVVVDVDECLFEGELVLL